VAGGLLYVEPIYIERAIRNLVPQLARVLVSFGGKIGYDPRLDVALNEVFGPGVATGVRPTPATGGGTPSPSVGGPAAAGELQAAVGDINAPLSRLRAAPAVRRLRRARHRPGRPGQGGEALHRGEGAPHLPPLRQPAAAPLGTKRRLTRRRPA